MLHDDISSERFIDRYTMSSKMSKIIKFDKSINYVK